MAYPKINPRVFVVQKADAEFRDALDSLQRKYSLTYSEINRILAVNLGVLAEYAIQAERREAIEKSKEKPEVVS